MEKPTLSNCWFRIFENFEENWKGFLLFSDVVDHLTHDVLAAATDYKDAETVLSAEFKRDPATDSWEPAGREAKRRAAQLAIAIDGLTDRCIAISKQSNLGWTKNSIRREISQLCMYPGTSNLRVGVEERIRGVANAYKHHKVDDPRIPIQSNDDVLVVGSAYGHDAFGIGKLGAPEVFIDETSGTRYKFLGDAPTAIAAWFKFLDSKNATLPSGPIVVLGFTVYP